MVSQLGSSNPRLQQKHEKNFFGYREEYVHFFMQEMAAATDYDGKASFTPLVGGTVNPMDKDTGELKNPYIYYCSGAGKEVDWASYKKASA